MSFNNPVIRKQLETQLSTLNALPATEITPDVRRDIKKIKKQIVMMDAANEAEKTARQEKIAHDAAVAAVKEKKVMAKAAAARGKGGLEQESYSMYKDKEIQCGDCGVGFVFSGRSQEKFAERQWTEPSRCDECREYRKQFEHKTLKCVECPEMFDFSVGAQIHYVEQGFEDPVLCRPCRVAKRKVIPPEMITCKECNKEFKFPYGEQMFFKEQGWQEPRRCIPCRKEHKAEYAAKIAARAAAKTKPDLGKFAEGVDLTMKFGPSPSAVGINPMDLIAAASAMVNGDGTFNVDNDKEEGWQTVGALSVP
jgi:hypothetical protein